MQASPQISTVAHVIQLAVAPVFLFSGVAALLGVLTNRLARIIDRARALEVRAPAMGESERRDAHGELRHLSQRARLINWAISLGTMCALSVCGVIVALFLGASLSIEVSGPVSVLFICSMLALFWALLCFLREIYVATKGLRIGPP